MKYHPVSIREGSSSLDIEPEGTLDPFLFDGARMKPSVRLFLLGTIQQYMDQRYRGSTEWLRAWLAGSGASYRWSAASDLKDLDVLLGVNFLEFRRLNQGFRQIGDDEIARHLNEELRHELWPTTSHWNDEYEITWFVNPHSWDIRAINPYAAYDLVTDGWSVPPSKDGPVSRPEWEMYAEMYRSSAHTAVDRYSQALLEVKNAQNPAHRRNAEVMFHHAVDQAVALFDNAHQGRRTAFTPTGSGYDDFSNFLWQRGKRDGWVPALKMIKDFHAASIEHAQGQTYGLELPSTDALVRRAALQYRNRP
jgi:hypothetical protein